MFFQQKNTLQQKNKFSSLSSKILPTSSKYDYYSFDERISLSASLRMRLSGSIMAEAAIALPVFLTACISLLFMIEVIRMQNTIQGALLRTGKSVSEVLCLFEMDGEDSAEITFPVGIKGFSVLAMQEMVLDKVTSEKLDNACIRGGSRGLSFLYSNVVDDWIDIIVQYKVKIPFSLIPLPEFQIVQRCRIRGWTGAEGLAGLDEGEIMVYMTPNGSVYHTNRNCTYLKLSIKSVLYMQVSSLRNSNGAKYYPCKRCMKKMNVQTVYITEDGTSYHSTLSCSELKRTVIAVPLSEVKDVRCCSRCGG